MAIIRLTADNFESIELLANPARTFSSSSSGITGSVALFADSGPSIKDLEPTFGAAGRIANEDQIDLIRNATVMTASSLTNVESSISNYLNLVGSASVPVRSSKRQEILRFTPGVTLEENFFRKGVVKNSLFPYYRNQYPTAQWAYHNYNCLNFVTGGNLPASSVLIYPAGTGTVANENFNPLGAANAFTFDFYINPRYSSVNPGGEFKAGTILHMSSCYALSLITGSSMGIDGKKDGYRILLQLSASADIPPSLCSVVGNSVTTSQVGADAGYLFASSDNSLRRNRWHHVVARWGGPSVNNGTGSFVIDGVSDNSFVINSSSCMQVSATAPDTLDPDALFVGNFYEGSNSGLNAIALFFNPAASRDEGVLNFSDNYPSTDPMNFTFAHPLNAEIHDVKIFNSYKLMTRIQTNSTKGSSLTSDLLFYLPPFFTKDTRKRLILQTPFFDAKGSTEDPFNVALSFGIGAMSINLENFTKDFVTNQFPRLLDLTASRIDTQVNVPQTANYLLYESGSTRKRNLTVVPCDNGKFFPNFDLLKTIPGQGITNAASGTSSTASYSGSYDDRFVDDFGQKNYSWINLRNMVSMSNLVPGTVSATRNEDGSLLASLEGATPEDPGVSPGNILCVLQRTHDPSSNEVVFFDVSNMFYGDRIEPGTLVVEDLKVSGSADRMTFKLKDDKRGNLYRADCDTKHATWASVGNVIYEEGIIVIKSPNMPFFGQDSFRITFEGQKSVYTLEMLIPATTSLFNSSSNPTYRELAPTDYNNETADKFTYLTGITLHDNNLNVIGRANLAQPIIKRETDRVTIRLRMDF